MKICRRWFRDKLSMKAKLEAKRRPQLSDRDLPSVKQRCGLGSVPESKLAELRDAWVRYDADGSGVITNDEFRRLAPEIGISLTPAGLRKAFEHLDADRSNEVSLTHVHPGCP